MIYTVTKKRWKSKRKKEKRKRRNHLSRQDPSLSSTEHTVHKLITSLLAVLSSKKFSFLLTFFLFFASSFFFFSFLFITLLDNQRLSSPAPKPRNTPSYTPNMIAALGTTRSTCGVRPPYMPAMPSTRQTVLKQSTRPV